MFYGYGMRSESGVQPLIAPYVLQCSAALDEGDSSLLTTHAKVSSHSFYRSHIYLLPTIHLLPITYRLLMLLAKCL